MTHVNQSWGALMHRLCSQSCENVQFFHHGRIARSPLSEAVPELCSLSSAEETLRSIPISCLEPESPERIGRRLCSSLKSKYFEGTCKIPALCLQCDRVQKSRCEFCCGECTGNPSWVGYSSWHGAAYQMWSSSLKTSDLEYKKVLTF